MYLGHAGHPIIIANGLELYYLRRAQWEKASRGVKGQIYPWGNQFKDNYCNIEGGNR